MGTEESAGAWSPDDHWTLGVVDVCDVLVGALDVELDSLETSHDYGLVLVSYELWIVGSELLIFWLWDTYGYEDADEDSGYDPEMIVEVKRRYDFLYSWNLHLA